MFKNPLLLLLIITSLHAFGKIIECSHFSEIYNHVDDKTLLILDIDDTLLIPQQMLGCDEWFIDRLQAHQNQGLSKQKALEKALAEWEAIRHLTDMDLVEQATDHIIKDLQEKCFTVMGLTTQGLALATRTSLQLLDNDINLTLTAPSKEDHYFLVNNHGILYRNGILFTSGQSKADAFTELCNRLGLYPKKIIFINDKESHLKDLETYAIKEGIEFIGLRYAYSDYRKQSFSKQIASYQFSHSSFDRILSDQEAQKELHAQAS